MALVGIVLIFILVFGLGMVAGGAVINSHYRAEIEELKGALAYLKSVPPQPLYNPTPKPWSKDDYT